MERTMYTKYREKMWRILKQYDGGDDIFVSDDVFENYGEYFLRTIKKDKTFKLYRYCGLTYNGEFSLSLDTLYCNSNGKMNDIFEGLPHQISNCEDLERYLQAIANQAYLKCFSETNDNNLMWAHYGDSYKGICIEYDICKLPDDNTKKMLFPVCYTNRRSYVLDTESLLEYYGNEHQNLTEKEIHQMTGDTKGIFVQKADFWKYEKEWRLCIINRKNSGEKCIELSFPCISAVYIGPRTSKSDISKIKKCVKEYEEKHNKKIEIYLMKLSNDTFQLYREKIND